RWHVVEDEPRNHRRRGVDDVDDEQQDGGNAHPGSIRSTAGGGVPSQRHAGAGGVREPAVRPPESTRPSARSFPVQTGFMKLILSSRIVNAMPIAASAMSARIPPCTVPIGLAWRSVASSGGT